MPKVTNSVRGNKASLSAECEPRLIIAKNKLGQPSNTFMKLKLIYYILNRCKTGLLTCSEQFNEVACNKNKEAYSWFRLSVRSVQEYVCVRFTVSYLSCYRISAEYKNLCSTAKETQTTFLVVRKI